MKFRNYGQVLLATVVSLGLVFGLSSCTSSYTVGFLYVVGTSSTTAPNAANGIISGFKIDHNTGKLTSISGLPIGSGGANPSRAVIPVGGRYVYVLNTGATGTGAGANISQFSIGGNGILFPVLPTGGSYTSQGQKPTRMLMDSSGRFLYVLDTKVPACDTVNTGGDVSAFSIDQTTGRLTPLLNSQLTESNACATANGDQAGSPMRYFPVPANATDMLLSGGYIFTLHSNSTIYPYAQNASSGQLVVSQSGIQYITGANHPIALTGSTGGTVYLLDEDSVTSGGVTSPSQILPFTIGTNGALSAQTSGAVANDPCAYYPTVLLSESGGKFVYVANAGPVPTGGNCPNSELSGFQIDSTSKNLSLISGEPFSSGSGPQSIVEDPSNQFVYTADLGSTVTGHKIDHGTGLLYDLNTSAQSYALEGPGAWCVVTGRTQ
jgi:6-phosphogluconolactonase (cycloisomerase 2 family)